VSAPSEGAVDEIESVAPLSILGSLRERRAQILEEQILPLAVPRWDDPKIVVKYKPVDHAIIRGIERQVDAAPKKDRAKVELNGNCDVLIRACTAVVAVLDDEEYSLRLNDPHGEPTIFDRDLGANLGLEPHATAREIVKALYITDGDILAAASAIGEFSGYRNQEADDGVSGES
jgi:hypothetical protein